MVSSLFLLAFLQAWVGGYWLKDAGKCQVLLGIAHSITLMRTLGLWADGDGLLRIPRVSDWALVWNDGWMSHFVFIGWRLIEANRSQT